MAELDRFKSVEVLLDFFKDDEPLIYDEIVVLAVYEYRVSQQTRSKTRSKPAVNAMLNWKL